MSKLLIVFLLLLIPTGFTFAEEFVNSGESEFEHFDDKKYMFTYEITGGNLNDIETFPQYQSVMFFVNGTDGKLTINIPKSIPFDHSDFSYEQYNFVLVNGEEVNPKTIVSDCYIGQTIPFDGQSEIEMIFGSVLAGPRITYLELPEICLDNPSLNTEIQQKLKTKNCNDDFEKGFNVRDEVVCISPESYPWLHQRGYLKTFPIIN